MPRVDDTPHPDPGAQAAGPMAITAQSGEMTAAESLEPGINEAPEEAVDPHFPSINAARAMPNPRGIRGRLSWGFRIDYNSASRAVGDRAVVRHASPNLAPHGVHRRGRRVFPPASGRGLGHRHRVGTWTAGRRRSRNVGKLGGREGPNRTRPTHHAKTRNPDIE